MKRLVVIFLIALVLRIIFVGTNPRGFNPDEASFGYDAYSIIKTGHDQWGKFMPLVFKSFGDYKAPIYGYLAMPSVAVFGLNPFAVRLPNVLLGSLAVLAVYLMTSEIFKYERHKAGWFSSDTEKKRVFVCTTSALLLAISPWHVAMSRGAFEANLTTLFIPMGIYLFYKYLNNEKQHNLLLCAIAFGLNLFTYHSAKLVTAVVLSAIFIIHFEDLKKNLKKLVFPAIVLSFFAILTGYTFMIGAGSRLADVSIFKLSPSSAASERIRAFNNGLPDQVSRLFHNKYQVFTKTAIGNYLSYLSPQFLFSRGAGERTYGMNDDRGVLYWFELPFLLYFFVWIIKRGVNKSIILLTIWFLVSPIPASLAVGPGFAANRAVVMLPSIYVFLALGAYEIANSNLGKLNKSYDLVKKLYPLFGLLFFIAFIENYFFVAPSKIAKSMLYGNLETFQYLRGTSRQVVVSRKLSEPHIYMAFANKTEPKLYQENSRGWNFEKSGLNWVDQMSQYSILNYLFKDIYYPEWKDKDVILVGRPDEFPENVIPIKKFADPSGTDLIYIVDTMSSYYAKGKDK